VTSPSSSAFRSSRPTLAAWLFVSVFGATVAAVLTCTLIIDGFVRDEARVEATLFLQTNADALRDALDRGMAQHYEEVRVIGQLDQVSGGTDPAAIRRALEQMHAGFPQFAWLGLTDRDGKVVAAIDGLLQGKDVSARPWFAGARHGMFVGDVHSALLLEKLLPAQAEPWRFVDLATPVYGPDGSLRGVLGGHLSWAWAAQIKHDLVDGALQQHQAEALIVGADGRVLLGPAGLQGQRLATSDPADTLVVQSRTRGSGRYPGLGWNVVLRQPEGVAMAHFRVLQVRTRIAAALLCLVFAPVLWLLARRLSTPLQELGKWLDAQFDTLPAQRRHPLYREADVLGVALDRFAQRQRDDADHLRDLNASLEARLAERTAALECSNEEMARAVRDRWQSEERLRAILTHAPEAYISIDEAGRISEWNREAEQIFGWTREEACGRPLVDLLAPPALRDTHRTGVDAFTRGAAGVGQRVELNVLRKGGDEIPVQLSAASLRTDGGQVVYAFVQDISARKRAERLLARSERRLRTVTDNMPALVSYIDTDLRYRFTNATYGRWFDIDPAALIGRSVLDIAGRENVDRIESEMRLALAGDPRSFEIEQTVRGRRMHNLIHYVPDVDDAGVVQGLYGTVLDLTERRDAEVARARSEQRLRAITDNMPGLIGYIDKEERYQFCNATYREWVGVEPAQVIGRTMSETLGEEAYRRRRAHLQRALAGERVDFDIETTWLGVTRHLNTTYLPEVDARTGVVDGVYALVTDITAMKAAESLLAHQAHTDSLTGLANRHAFNEKLAEALARSRRGGQPIALFFLDVDKFKGINDSLGHGVGDEVLKTFAQRLLASVRETDTVARLAGDEFVVVLEGLHTPAEPQFIARKVLAAIGRPFEVGGLRLDVTTSIGVAFQRDGAILPAELLALADKALYEAKDGGRNTFRMAAA
jgi:diguanylate cyclase (GGDEF)-like protein/PAS domain S-box-containing protein